MKFFGIKIIIAVSSSPEKMWLLHLSTCISKCFWLLESDGAYVNEK